MSEFWEALGQLFASLGTILYYIGDWAVHWAVLIAWLVWWLLGVNWAKVWPVLRTGAWTVLILLVLTAALVWSQLDERSGSLFGLAIPNFWWQLMAVGSLVVLTLSCGWLQGVFGWAPAEVDLEPTEVSPAVHGGHH